MTCRFCHTPLEYIMVDLGNSPPSNSFLTSEHLEQIEPSYPLKVFVCHECWLVQLDEYKKATEIFSDEYVYFSSYSQTWLEHALRYTNMMIKRFLLSPDARIVEIASNDGYLLQYFAQKGFPVLGIEPTTNTAAVARKKGIRTMTEFFGVQLAESLKAEGIQAELLIGNNVLAHVPDLHDFVGGLKILLAPQGIMTMEFPHLCRLIEENQFDTIYHEHFSYLSLYSVTRIFSSLGLRIFDVEELPTHGGSLRVFATHADNALYPTSNALQTLTQREEDLGMSTVAYYQHLQTRAEGVKTMLLDFLRTQKRSGKTVVGYGAAAKGNTLLNYCGIRADLLPFVVDISPYKQGKYLPGSRIPVVSEEKLKELQPDFVLILPWNIQNEIMQQLSYIRGWNGQFVVAIPELTLTKAEFYIEH